MADSWAHCPSLLAKSQSSKSPCLKNLHLSEYGQLFSYTISVCLSTHACSTGKASLNKLQLFFILPHPEIARGLGFSLGWNNWQRGAVTPAAAGHGRAPGFLNSSSELYFWPPGRREAVFTYCFKAWRWIQPWEFFYPFLLLCFSPCYMIALF